MPAWENISTIVSAKNRATIHFCFIASRYLVPKHKQVCMYRFTDFALGIKGPSLLKANLEKGTEISGKGHNGTL